VAIHLIAREGAGFGVKFVARGDEVAIDLGA
jgi:hypothetical protein